MRLKIVLIALVICLGFGCARESASDDLAQSVLTTLKEYDPALSLPRDTRPIRAKAVLKKDPDDFQYIIEGDKYDVIKQLFKTVCGDPLIEKGETQDGRRDTVFAGRALRYAITYLPETKQTLIFGITPKSADK